MLGHDYIKRHNKVVRGTLLKRFAMNVKAEILEWSKGGVLKTNGKKSIPFNKLIFWHGWHHKEFSVNFQTKQTIQSIFYIYAWHTG